MDKLDKISNFQKECIRNCVIHRRAMIYKSAHKELTEQEVIKACRNIAGYSDNEVFELKDYCKAAGVEEKDVINFINDVMQDAKDDDSSITSLSDDEIETFKSVFGVIEDISPDEVEPTMKIFFS